MKSPKTLPQLRRALAPVALAGLALLGSWSCDSANPLAPPGTILTISASPSRIGLNGVATITVTGRRPDGNPLSDGTEIRLSTSLGAIEGIVQTDENGVARGTLQADGRAGTATVTATVGGETEATINVVIGELPETQPQVTVSVNPDNIPVGDNSFATVTVVVREVDNSPAGAGIPVTLTSNLGTLDPTTTATDANGVATATLAAGTQPGTATVTAFVGGAEPATADLTIRDAAADISLQPDPTSIPRGGATIQLIAFVSSKQGLPLQGQIVTFEADLGSFANTTAFTNQGGRAQVPLTVMQADIGDEVTSFNVRALAPTETGEFIMDEKVIEIR